MEQKDEKRFSEWIILKEKLHNARRKCVIREKQVWWAALGENIGIEINGKNEKFDRPVLIFKKLGKEGFMGIPLTSQPHWGTWYVRIMLKGKSQYAALAQARVMSVSRLYYPECYGELSDKDFQKICDGFEKLYLNKNITPNYKTRGVGKSRNVS